MGLRPQVLVGITTAKCLVAAESASFGRDLESVESLPNPNAAKLLPSLKLLSKFRFGAQASVILMANYFCCGRD